MAGIDVGTGLTMNWNSTITGNAAFPMEIIGASFDGEEVPVIDTSHMGSTGIRTKMKGDLRDEGTFDAECHLDPHNLFRAGSTGTVLITIPHSTNAGISGGLIAQRLNYTIPMEDKMICSYTFAWAGAYAVT